MKNKKLISKAVKPNGRHISKTGSYKFVLVYNSQTTDRNLAMWSNKKETLEKHIKLLVKFGWDESVFTILDTVIE